MRCDLCHSNVAQCCSHGGGSAEPEEEDEDEEERFEDDLPQNYMAAVATRRTVIETFF